MSTPEIFRVGDDRLLCDAWHDVGRTVVVRPVDPRLRVDPDAIVAVLGRLAERGVMRVLTAALDENAIAPFAAAGFHLHEELCVLRLDLDTTDARAAAPTAATGTTSFSLRRGRPRRELSRVAEIDERAFGPGRAVDGSGLATIIAATPARRFRVVTTHGMRACDAAYAVSGCAGTFGYIQRVAVDPTFRRCGHGRALVTDALGWFRRRGVCTALVNTQPTNTAGCNLYRSVGFVPTSDRLAVWAWDRTTST
ncbi:MAG: GNAT family N-acetyltransferase [Actinobacteria bacterium]|nr:GNAT family N-acetyltransferase [Actinomycetota bacterium]